MLIKDGNYQWRVEQAGEGSPVVVFEAGMGEDHQTWQDVQPAIARLTRTVSYDRAGLGQSSPGPAPRTAAALGAELRRLLHAIPAAGPYILVGHSLGGNIITCFAHQFPAETAGLVFVDTGFSEERLRQAVSADDWAARERAIAQYVPPFSPGQALERDATAEGSRLTDAARPLPDVPAVVLSGTLINPDFPLSAVEREVKLQTHRELAAALPHSEHILVPEARHYLQNETPGVVVEGIRKMVEQLRS